jgi:DNA-directed RNA polymerase subunit L
MGLSWEAVGTLDPDAIDTQINHIKKDIAKHAKVSFEKVGIRYLDWTNYLKPGEISTSIRSFAYYLMLFHVLQGHYVEDIDGVHTLIPMTPHISWYKLFDQILILDATASVCDYMYQQYPMLKPGQWNYQDITLGLKYFSTIGNLSKTKTAQHRETIVNELEHLVLPHLEDQGFADPYVVTYKMLNGESFPQDISAILGKRPVQNYGGTRGSNAFRQCDSVILVGAYRPPVSFDTLAYQLFGSAYSPYKYAVAHWIQEIYRTRIRQHRGEPIQVLAIGQREVIEAFETVIDGWLHPISVGQRDNPAYIEKILRDEQHTVRKILLEELTKKRRVPIKDFADRHTQRSRAKVERACRGLLHDHPMLQGHLRMDGDYLQLVDIACPV